MNGERWEIVMPSVRKQVERICVGLYFAAALLGMSVEAIAQIFPH
jgi:hypothetical protein